MTQERSTAFPRHQKQERSGINNDKTNTTYEKNGKRKVQGAPQSQTAVIPRH